MIIMIMIIEFVKTHVGMMGCGHTWWLLQLCKCPLFVIFIHLLLRAAKDWRRFSSLPNLQITTHLYFWPAMRGVRNWLCAFVLNPDPALHYIHCNNALLLSPSLVSAVHCAIQPHGNYFLSCHSSKKCTLYSMLVVTSPFILNKTSRSGSFGHV